MATCNSHFLICCPNSFLMGTTLSSSLWYWWDCPSRVLSHHSGGANYQSENLISVDTEIGRLGTGPNKTKQSSSGDLESLLRKFLFQRPWTAFTLESWICQGPAFPLCRENLPGNEGNKTRRSRYPVRVLMTSVEGLYLSLPELLLSLEPIKSPFLKVKFGFQRKEYWLIIHTTLNIAF